MSPIIGQLIAILQILNQMWINMKENTEITSRKPLFLNQNIFN
jgi:hypothetical protein